MPVQIETDQNNLIVFTKLTFESGLVVITYASPLSPEIGREVLGSFTEDYTLVGLQRPVSKAYPFLRDTRISESYIKSVLGVDVPVSSLLFDIMPQLTSIDLPDNIAATADRWYRTYF